MLKYLISRTKETRYIKWHETCKCKFRLDASVCNNKQRWNEGKCKCECKQLIVKGICDKGFNRNPSNCECECDISCDAGEYLDYKNCKCRKRSVDKLGEECSENIDEKELHPAELHSHNLTLKWLWKISSSCERSCCTICIVFFCYIFNNKYKH